MYLNLKPKISKLDKVLNTSYCNSKKMKKIEIKNINQINLSDENQNDLKSSTENMKMDNPSYFETEAKHTNKSPSLEKEPKNPDQQFSICGQYKTQDKMISPQHSLSARKSGQILKEDSPSKYSNTVDFNFKRCEIRTSVKQYRNVLMNNKKKIIEQFGKNQENRFNRTRLSTQAKHNFSQSIDRHQKKYQFLNSFNGDLLQDEIDRIELAAKPTIKDKTQIGDQSTTKRRIILQNKRNSHKPTL